MRYIIAAIIGVLLLMNVTSSFAEPVVSVERFIELIDRDIEMDEKSLEKMIKHRNVTESKIESKKGVNRSLYFADLLKETYESCMSYLFEADTITGIPSDYKILRFGTYYPYGYLNECIFVDFENKLFYYDEIIDIFADIDKASHIGKLTEEQQDSISKLIDETPWANFEYLYILEDSAEVITDQEDWSLAFETNKGIIRYTIDASVAAGPAELISFGKKVINILIDEKR